MATIPFSRRGCFGLSNPQGNHGEDLKEYFYHLDNTPDPQFHAGALQVSATGISLSAPDRRERTSHAPGRRNLNSSTQGSLTRDATSTFSSSTPRPRQTTFASGFPRSIAVLTRLALTILPTLWFRNTWSWGREGSTKPQMHLTSDKSIRAAPWGLPVYHLYCEGASEFVFTDNETNNERLFGAKNTCRSCQGCLPRLHCPWKDGRSESGRQRNKSITRLSPHHCSRRNLSSQIAAHRDRLNPTPLARPMKRRSMIADWKPMISTRR